jgi:glutaredoxin
MNQQKIDVYYYAECGACKKAIEYLESQGLDFCAFHVEWNEEADRFEDSANTREMYRRCGEQIDFVPQVFVGETHIPGWMKMRPMTESGEFDKLARISHRIS